jgi:hypothetical protein
MESKKINQLATEMAPASTDLTIIGDPITGVSKKVTLEQISSLFSGLVSFYANYAAFPATGAIDTIYCAKDTSKLYLWSGSAYVEVFPSQALLDTYQLRSEKGNANGYASLDSLGKVPISQLPSSLMEYKGTWNAATNTPTLANGTGDTGDVYICSVAGTVNFGAGAITFAVGDYVIYSGTIWQRSSGAVGTVTSVAVTESSAALSITGSPITTSGTINIGFAGASTDYVAGDGSLVPFPTVVTQAQNLVTEVYNETGATLTKGTVVYINGGHGNLPTITKALATGDSTSAQTYGVVRTDITNNNNGYVTVIGNIDNIDTQAYAAGTQLYLSSTTAGAWTSTKQYAPAHLVYVGIVTRSHPTQGVVEIRIQNGFEMDELHNVSAQSPSNNDGIFYNTSTSLWEKKSIATVLGFTPANAALVVPYTGATGNVTLGAYKLTATNLEVLGATASIKATDTGAQLGIGVAANSGAISIASNGNVYLNSDVYLDTGYIGSGGGMLKYSSIGKLTKAVAGTDYVAPSALSGYLPLTGGTLTGALGGTSATFSGNVGIGNTASSPLDVTADNSTAINLRLRGRAADSVGQMEFWNNAQSTRYGYIATDSTAMSMVSTQAIPLILGTNSTTRLTIASTGAATFSSTIQSGVAGSGFSRMNKGTSTQAGYFEIFKGDGSTRLGYMGYDNTNFAFTAENSANFSFGGGNVGIGTSSPSYLLDVNGSSRVLNTFLVDSTTTAELRLRGGNYGSNYNTSLRSITGASGVLQFGNNDINYILAGNTAAGGYLSIRVNCASESVASGSEAMRITNAGQVQIKTPTTADALDITGAGNYWVALLKSTTNASQSYGLRINAGTNSSDVPLWIFDASSTNTLLKIRGDGYTFSPYTYNATTGGGANMHIASDGSLNRSTSSLKYKKDVRDYDKGLAEVMQMRPVYYKGKSETDGDKQYAGLIAEEIHDLGLTEFVQYADDETPDALAYSNMVALLVKAIQELEARLKTIENK